MTGLGGLNKSPNGVVVGLVQLQLPLHSGRILGTFGRVLISVVGVMVAVAGGASGSTTVPPAVSGATSLDSLEWVSSQPAAAPPRPTLSNRSLMLPRDDALALPAT